MVRLFTSSCSPMASAVSGLRALRRTWITSNMRLDRPIGWTIAGLLTHRCQQCFARMRKMRAMEGAMAALAGFETVSVLMEAMLLLRFQAPEGDVERIMAAVTTLTPLAVGKYDHNAYQA